MSFVTYLKLSPAQSRCRVMWGHEKRSFEEVIKNVPAFVMRSETYRELPRYHMRDVGITNPLSIIRARTVIRTQVFVLVIDHTRHVLVNTGGFSYCKYCAPIVIKENGA